MTVHLKLANIKHKGWGRENVCQLQNSDGPIF